MLVGQSVLLGYLTDTFTLTIEEQPDNSSSSRNTSAESGGVDIPTARYLYAGGKWGLMQRKFENVEF